MRLAIACLCAALWVESALWRATATSEQDVLQEIVDGRIGEESHCGAIGAVGSSGHLETRSGPLLASDCELSLLLNCTITYHPIICPAECPYLAQDPSLSCFVKCTPGERCSRQNADRPFPDDSIEKHYMCEACSVDLCKECITDKLCKVCHDGFALSNNGEECVFSTNLGWLDHLVMVLAVLVLLMLLLAVVWNHVYGNHVRAKQHMVASLRSRRHRHLCKTARWRLESRTEIREWHNLSMNIHTKNVVGVGIPLFYNHLCFLMVIALLFTGATYWLFALPAQTGEPHNVLAFAESHVDNEIVLEDDTFLLPERQPALIVSPLKLCGAINPQEVRGNQHGLAEKAFKVMGGLYVITFALSLLFGLHQKKAAVDFDAENITMSDYALRVSGLPKTDTDEPELRDKLEKLFRKGLPGQKERPERIKFSDLGLSDEIEQVAPSQIEVWGVSVCYDYTDRTQIVDDSAWKMLELMEVEMHKKAAAITKNEDWIAMTGADLDVSDTSFYFDEDGKPRPRLQLTEAHEIISERVRGLFEGADRLKSNGEVFVLFKYTRDRESVFDFYKKNPEAFKLDDGTLLNIASVFSEPHAITWWSAGMPMETLLKRCAKAVAAIFCIITALELLINLPYYWFIQRPYRNVGSVAEGTVTGVYGLIIGNLNGLVFWGIYMIGEAIGFHQKDSLYNFVATLTVFFICIMNTVNIFLNAKMVAGGIQDTGYGAMYDVTLKYLAIEIRFSKTMLDMLIPGYFFAGSIMKIIMPTVFSVWCQFLQKLIYVWRCLPDPILKAIKAFMPWKPDTLEHLPFRNAEKCVDPWEIPIMGDYADLVATPMICFTALMFMSTYVHRIFLGLFAWAVFHYFYFRFMHLRFHRMNFFTTNRLSNVGLYLWGFAFSVVAAHCTLWGFRAGRFGQGWPIWVKTWSVLFTYAVSVVLWFVAYHFIVKPWDELYTDNRHKDVTFWDTKLHTVYSWLNCNPVFALKCRYFYQDVHGEASARHPQGSHPLACGEDPKVVRIYEVGKEYLFVKPERQWLLCHHMSDWLEPEFWTDRLIGFFAKLRHLCTREAARENAYTHLDGADTSDHPL